MTRSQAWRKLLRVGFASSRESKGEPQYQTELRLGEFVKRLTFRITYDFNCVHFVFVYIGAHDRIYQSSITCGRETISLVPSAMRKMLEVIFEYALEIVKEEKAAFGVDDPAPE